MLQSAGPAFLQALSDVLPVEKPSPGHLEDPRGRLAGRAEVLVRPRTVDEVSAVIRLAGEHKVGVIPYGGGTGLVGGQLQGPDGPAAILLGLDRMNNVRSISPLDNVIEVEAGVILADVQAAAAAVDRLFPLSLAAEGSARIGGNLATNAGGVQVLRYGNTRDLCLGLEAVLPDGSIHHGLRRLRKDNTGYDLRHLLIGSEGTLGVITAASLKLFPKPKAIVTAMVAVSSPDAALTLLRRLQDQLGDAVTAFELIHGQGLAFLAEHMPNVTTPFAERPGWSVLFEVSGAGHGDAVENLLESSFGEVVHDAYIAQNQSQAAAFWSVREHLPEANRAVGAIASHDISVPIGCIPEFISRGEVAIGAISRDIRINCFGHLGDGNLHYNLFPPQGQDKSEFVDIRASLTRKIHDLVAEFDGSFSAEHGVGRLKREDLGHYGDPAKLAAMRAIKAALDPLGIMNPGALFLP